MLCFIARRKSEKKHEFMKPITHFYLVYCTFIVRCF